MSVKGFFIALLCVVAGGIGAFYSLLGIVNTNGSPSWIALLIVSFIAVLFGMGVLSNRIKF